MTFVYRKEKQEPNNGPTPGPGQYNIAKETTIVNSSASFAGKVSRKLWQIAATPGPGQYNPVTQKPEMDGSNVLLGNANLQFYVTESFHHKKGGCRSIFRSESKKIASTFNNNPGPGQYQITNAYERREPSGCRWSKPTKLMRYLYEETTKPAKCLAQMAIKTQQKLVQQIHKKGLESSPKLKTESKNNYKSIFNSKVERKVVSRPQTSNGVGPGTYNIAQSFSNIDRKSFHCKASTACSNIQGHSAEEKKEKEAVGPGYYEVQFSSLKRPQTSQSKGIPCFGSRQRRFQGRKTISSSKGPSQPGPQSYFKPSPKPERSKTSKNVGFNSCAKKSDEFFYIKPSTNFTEVSPCSYRPRNDFNELLKKNYVKGTIGRFGSTVERFKEVDKSQDEPSQASGFILEYEGVKKGNENQKERHYNSFQRLTKSIPKPSNPQPKEQALDERPLCYDTYSRTISSKFSIKYQKEAPFLVASQRFATKQPNFEQEIVNQILKDQNKSISVKGQGERSQNKKQKLFKGSQNVSVLKKYHKLRCEDPFGKDQKENEALIGPQTYNPQAFTKKSYNVLFQN